MAARFKNLEGYCLVAGEGLQGSPFAKSLILITHHARGEGTLGVIFNQVTKRTLGEFLTSVPDKLLSTSIYIGGPVESQMMTLIGLKYSGNQLEIRSHLTPMQAGKFMEDNPDGSQLRAYLGYAGWAAGQLEEEIEKGDWRLLPFTPALLEPIHGESLWKWAVEQTFKQ